MRIRFSKFVQSTVAAGLVSACMPSAFAQPSASNTVVAQDAASAANVSKREAREEAKAQRKAARKAARAKNSAEIKRLEDAGYTPGGDFSSYPQNAQNAQKKAAEPSGASK